MAFKNNTILQKKPNIFENCMLSCPNEMVIYQETCNKKVLSFNWAICWPPAMHIQQKVNNADRTLQDIIKISSLL